MLANGKHQNKLHGKGTTNGNFDSITELAQRTESVTILHTGDAESLAKNETQIILIKKISEKMSQLSHDICHMTYVTGNVSHVTNANSHSLDPPPANSRTMHSRIVCKDQIINFFPRGILNRFGAKITKSETNVL